MTQFAMVPIEVCMDSRLSKMQIRVLITLLSFRNKDTNLVWPKREKIAERCGYEITVISRVTRQLVDLGWIQKTGKGGFSKSTEYRITVPELVTVDNEELEQKHQNNSDRLSHGIDVNNSDQTGNGDRFGNGDQTGQSTVTKPVTSTVTKPVTRKEQTIEQTKNRPVVSASYLPQLDFSSWNEFPTKQVWEDFSKVRKAKRAPWSQTVINQLGKQLQIAIESGYTVDYCLTVAIEANWQTFKFDWLQNRENRNAISNNPVKKSRSEQTDDDEAAYLRSLGIEPSTGFANGSGLDGIEKKAISS